MSSPIHVLVRIGSQMPLMTTPTARSQRRARQPPLVAALMVAALALAACGEKDEPESAATSLESGSESAESASGEIPGGADSADAQVIDEWSQTLSEGDVEGAAEFFAIPSVAENGPSLIEIQNLGDARQFNESLPCGAELMRAESEGDFTVATFRLTERPGGSCGAGTGGTAQTSFVIEGSKIAEWRRVGAGSGALEEASGSSI